MNSPLTYPSQKLFVSAMLDDNVTEKTKTGTCAATFVIIGAVAFPMVFVGGLLLGYGLGTSLLIALALAAPVAVTSVFVLRWLSKALTSAGTGDAD